MTKQIMIQLPGCIHCCKQLINHLHIMLHREEKRYSYKKYKRKGPKEFMNDLSIGHADSRVAYEDRNVIIRKAYLYTITIEDDNDFHLLIGTTAVYDPATTRVFNAEVPGVPTNGSAATKEHIRELREKLLNIFNGIPVCGRNGYLQQYTKIFIRGSLFPDFNTGTPKRKNQMT